MDASRLRWFFTNIFLFFRIDFSIKFVGIGVVWARTSLGIFPTIGCGIDAN
jgi:hypothetical protein